MLAHTRAMIAASVFALITGRKVAGMYDHVEGRDRRIAAEARGTDVQGRDGDRGVKFGGTLPEIQDSGAKTFISCEIDGSTAQGFDRASSTHYSARVEGGLVQVYDHGKHAWFSYDIQDVDASQSYLRDADTDG